MKNKLIQISILLFLFFTTQAYSNPINKINFIGLNNTSESSLLKLLPFKLGQNFSPYASDKIIEALNTVAYQDNNNQDSYRLS
jgi:outer membrane protein assembly factor BamA